MTTRTSAIESTIDDKETWTDFYYIGYDDRKSLAKWTRGVVEYNDTDAGDLIIRWRAFDKAGNVTAVGDSIATLDSLV